MKRMNIIVCMAVAGLLTACAKHEAPHDIVVTSEKPFMAAPTNQAIYEDCKHAIELYEKKDPKYAMTACARGVYVMIETSRFYQDYAKLPKSEKIKSCAQEISLKNDVDFEKSFFDIAMIKLLVKLYKNKTKSDPMTSEPIQVYFDQITKCIR